MRKLMILALLLIVPAAFAQEKPKLNPGVYAHFETSMGNFTAELYEKQAPITVANFIGLADGTKAWKDPKTKADMKNKRYYDGLIFHRVISGFMIQGGDPTGTGTGNPGFTIKDEFNPELKHDRPGRLAMARLTTPNSAGSQFYIIVAPQPGLDGAYAVFGQVVEGMDIVQAIGKTKTGPGDRPVTPVVMKKVTIERVQ